ncbi:hypothetical protein Tco_1063894 [Tanacetum coccineum]
MQCLKMVIVQTKLLTCFSITLALIPICNTPKSGLQRNVEYSRALLSSSIPADNVPADSSSSIPADNVPAGSSSSIPADYVSAGHVLVSADRDRIC